MMRQFNLLMVVVLFVLLVFSSPGVNAEGENHKTWEGIQKLMSASEFKAAGLDKLSPRELQQLDQWLVHFLAYDSQQVVRDNNTIQKLQKQPVRHRIPGHFSGWDGNTVFTLDNGEVWKQRWSGIYRISLEDPEVEISKNPLGFYELKIVKTKRKVGVTRVK